MRSPLISTAAGARAGRWFAGRRSDLSDTTDMICWGTTTVDTGLSVRIELDYLGSPCLIIGEPDDADDGRVQR